MHLTQREKRVLRLRDLQGLTFKAIGHQLGVTGGNIRVMYNRARERVEDFARLGGESLFLLPVRVRRLLKQCKISNREQARAAILSGELSWDTARLSVCWHGYGLRQCSRYTWVALNKWVGLPPS